MPSNLAKCVVVAENGHFRRSKCQKWSFSAASTHFARLVGMLGHLPNFLFIFHSFQVIWQLLGCRAKKYKITSP